MRIIIVGAGKVGYSLAEKLSIENHDVFLVELSAERLAIVEQNLDIQCIEGDGASISILEQAEVNNADMLIAVTNTDEVNILACLLAKEFSVPRTIARVKNQEYIREKAFRFKNWGIDLVINPDVVAAETISRLVEVPEAINVEYYARGRVQLLELRIDDDSPVIGKKLSRLRFDPPYLIVAILRNSKIIIPHGDDEIIPEDIVFVVAETKKMVDIERILGKKRIGVKGVTILGGGEIGASLAKILEDRNVRVKLIEKDYKRCEYLSSTLKETLVIHGDGTDMDLLEEEDIASSNLFIALTGEDKTNLLVSLLAKHIGVERTLAQIKRTEYIPLVEKIGVDVAISPRMITAGAILKFIRRGQILSVTLFEEAKAEMLELIAPEKGKIINKPLKNVRLPKGVLIGAIARNDEVIVPKGEDKIKPGDLVMVFSLPQNVPQVERLFMGR